MKIYSRVLEGKKLKKLRQSNIIPAVIYGNEVNLPIQITEKDFEKAYKEYGHTGIIKTELNGNKYNILFDEIQLNPVSRKPFHVSLRNVNLKEEITATVPVVFINTETSKGVKEDGGIVVENTHEIEVISLPTEIPSSIEVDVQDLSIGEFIKLEDIKLPAGVRFATEDENILSQIVVIISHKAAEEPEVQASDEVVVAEAIKEKKDQPEAEDQK